MRGCVISPHSSILPPLPYPTHPLIFTVKKNVLLIQSILKLFNPIYCAHGTHLVSTNPNNFPILTTPLSNASSVNHLANPSDTTLQNQRPLYPTHLSPQLMHSHFTEPILSSHLSFYLTPSIIVPLLKPNLLFNPTHSLSSIMSSHLLQLISSHTSTHPLLPHSQTSWLKAALPEHQRTQRRILTWRVCFHWRPAE